MKYVYIFLNHLVFAITSVVLLCESYGFLFIYYCNRGYYLGTFAYQHLLLPMILFSSIVGTGSVLLLYKSKIIKFLPTAVWGLICFVSSLTPWIIGIIYDEIKTKLYWTCLLFFVAGACAFVTSGITLLILYRNSITAKSIGIILVCAVFSLMFTLLMPTKFCLSSLPKNSDREYYIVNQATRSIIGDNNGLYQDDTRRELFVPMHIWDSKVYSTVFGKLSRDIWWGTDTLFIIYGEATIEKNIDEDGEVFEYTIDIDDWDIYGKINTNNKFRALFPKNYLTIYDYYWFDYVRDYLFAYYDGTVSNF
ncbi:MAG: hypothetical protein IJN48_02390 [Clostridia bacterium]|nr:hypothetical protein [Clostridia bacterium]